MISLLVRSLSISASTGDIGILALPPDLDVLQGVISINVSPMDSHLRRDASLSRIPVWAPSRNKSRQSCPWQAASFNTFSIWSGSKASWDIVSISALRFLGTLLRSKGSRLGKGVLASMTEKTLERIFRWSLYVFPHIPLSHSSLEYTRACSRVTCEQSSNFSALAHSTKRRKTDL